MGSLRTTSTLSKPGPSASWTAIGRSRVGRYGGDPTEYCALCPQIQKFYDFEPLKEFYDAPFCRALARAWQHQYGNITRDNTEVTSNAYYALIRFLLFIAEKSTSQSTSSTKKLYNCFRHFETCAVSDEILSDALILFRKEIEDGLVGRKTIKSKNSLISDLSRSLRALANAQFIPTPGRIKEFKLPVSNLNSRQSLAEIASATKNDTAQTLSYDDLAEAQATSNKALIGALRGCLESILVEELEAFQNGQAILARRDLPTVEDIDRVLAQSKPGSDVRNQQRLDEVLSRGNPEMLLATTVKYIHDKYGIGFESRELPSQIYIALSRIGGSHEVLRRLEGTWVSLICCYGIVLIDSSMNIGPSQKLAANPFIGSVRQGKRMIGTVSAIKRRARDKPVDGLLADDDTALLSMHSDTARKISGIKAIEIWQQLSAPIRRRAERAQQIDDLQYLWVVGARDHRDMSKVTSRPPFHTWWKQILKRIRNHPTLGNLPITLATVRATNAQIEGARWDYETVIPRALLEHSSERQTFAYTTPRNARRSLLKLIRSFQQLLEAVLTTGLSDVSKRLGIDPDELQTRRELGIETGLGFLCINSHSGIAPNSQKGERCLTFSACPACPMMRFVPNAASLEALHIMNKALIQRQQLLLRLNPNRWIAVWLPWLALTEAVIGKLKAGIHAANFKKATLEAERKLSCGEIAFPIIN